MELSMNTTKCWSSSVGTDVPQEALHHYLKHEKCVFWFSSFYRNATQKKQRQNYTEMALEKKNFHFCSASYSENGGNMPRSAKSSML